MRPRETDDLVTTRDRGPARRLALDHYIEMIVRTCTVGQVRQRSVAVAIDRIRETSQRERTQWPQDQRFDARGQ
jgi:hypothetical protein